jgi:hypothetical protein
MKPQVFERCFDRLLAEPGTAADVIVAQFCEAGDDGDAAREELVALVAELGEARKSATATSPEALVRWAMGRVMGPLVGRVVPIEVQMSVMHEMRAHVAQSGDREKAVME